MLAYGPGFEPYRHTPYELARKVLAAKIDCSSHPLKLVSPTGLEPVIRGQNRVCWVPPVFPKVTLTSPQCLISLFTYLTCSALPGLTVFGF